MHILIIGMGIGQLYKSVLEPDHKIYTLDMDPNVNADFKTVEEIRSSKVPRIDIAIICTPNYTHEPLAHQVANLLRPKIIFVEKPGLETSSQWQTLCDSNPGTKFVMVKNNQYRSELSFFRQLYDRSSGIAISWLNNNRIPKPGSWFTTKKLAFGGVSRDLMPHLLSYVCAIEPKYQNLYVTQSSKQNHKLSDIVDSEYGLVDVNGTYDVDDAAYCNLGKFSLAADWKTNLGSDYNQIKFLMSDRTREFELGLCPEYAYRQMIDTAIHNINNAEWFAEQYNQDMWIHRILEKF